MNFGKTGKRMPPVKTAGDRGGAKNQGTTIRAKGATAGTESVASLIQVTRARVASRRLVAKARIIQGAEGKSKKAKAGAKTRAVNPEPLLLPFYF
jgi:hypothetical protein